MCTTVLFLISAEDEEDSCIMLSIVVDTTLFWLHFQSVKGVKDSRVFVLFCFVQFVALSVLCSSRSDKI
jgi:hypothetical protein